MNKIKNNLIKKNKNRKSIKTRTIVVVTAALTLLFLFVGFKPQKIQSKNYSNINYYDNDKGFKISFVGDIMLGRYVDAQIKREGVREFYQEARSVWKDSDVVLANLESSVIRDFNGKYTKADKNIHLAIEKESLENLKDNGVTTVGFANNHALDYGQKGLRESLKIFDELSLDFLGVADKLSNKDQTLVKTINYEDFKIGIIAYSEILPKGFAAKKNRAGVLANTDRFIEDLIKQGKENHDFMVVMAHWGEEYVSNPTKTQVQSAHKLVDAGADLIIGSHPHVIQPIEKYNDSLIFYSMGNFIFDQVSPQTTESMIATAQINKDKSFNIVITPMEIINSKPYIVDNKKNATSIFKRLTQNLLETDYEVRGGKLHLKLK